LRCRAFHQACACL